MLDVPELGPQFHVRLEPTYQRCLDIALNPTGDPNSEACNLITRNPVNGAGATVDRSFTNAGYAKFSGIDLSVNWSHQLENGGGLNLNFAANAPLEEITRDADTIGPSC